MNLNSKTKISVGGHVGDKDLPAPPSYPPTKGDWNAYRSILTDLYWIEDRTLPEVIQIMKERYNFKAT